MDKVADTQCSGYTADYTRCYLPAGAARAGELVDVSVQELHADGLHVTPTARPPDPRGTAILSPQVSVEAQLKSDLATAMKAGEKERVGALRMVLSELQKDAKLGGGDELAVLRRERKRRLEAAEAYREGGARSWRPARRARRS